MISDRFGVLFICYANLCRSPMAERLAERAFEERFGADAAQVRVGSAGTHARTGSGMHPSTAQVLGERGAETANFASRPMNQQLIEAADLVLTATREQRAACVTLVPAAVRKTFTLRQFARMSAGLVAPGSALATGSPPVRLRTLLDEVLLSRSRLQPADASEDDLADPMGRPVPVFRACAVEIERALDAVIGVITAP